MKTSYLFFTFLLLFFSCSSTDWKEIQTLEGQGNKKSSFFEIKGNKIKISYTYQASKEMQEMNMGAFSVYVLEKEEKLEMDGSEPEVMISSPKAQNEIEIYDLVPGIYFIEVSSLNGEWKVSIKDFK